MDENEPLSEKNNIPFGHNRTNPITPFTLNSTSKLSSCLHFRYSIVTPRFIPPANTAQFDNHNDNGFHNTFDCKHSIYRDYLLCTVTASAHIMP